MPDTTYDLKFGTSGRLQGTIDSDRLLVQHAGPPGIADVRARAAAALAQPIEFPSLEQAVLPDDKIALVLDVGIPHVADLIAAVWDRLTLRGVDPANVTILQPSAAGAFAPADPRSGLPWDIRNEICWLIHDPAREDACHYLATTASGERIYLAEPLVNADIALTIGSISYDTLLGYRGTSSAFYPGMSSIDAIRKSHGQGHDELTPDDDRPLRQLVDEVGWLLGSQFSILALPGRDGELADVIAGLPEAVLKHGKAFLKEHWQVEVAGRPELVLATVDADTQQVGWPALTAALDAARRIVARDGRIVVLCDLIDDPGEGIQLIEQARTPRDALKPLRLLTPADLIPATQLAQTLDWANVYLLSELDAELVEDLFMIPLADVDEAQRLLAGQDDCAILAGAQHTYARSVDA